MSLKKKEELEEWHTQQVQRAVIFDLQEELQAYCESDVLLLKSGCEAFIQEFSSIAGFNPLLDCVTIASACNFFWRKRLLKEDLIAIEPVRGWRGPQVNQSKVALEWLYWEQSQQETVIKHVRNGGEQSVLTPAQAFFVDGYDADKNTIYEFHGCVYHGCPKCFPKSRDMKRFCHPDRTTEEVYQVTLGKIEQLRAAGYNVKQMWECEWYKMKKEEEELKSFLQDLTIPPPLEPRDAFFGGRTGAATLYAKIETPQEEIRYVDVTSLYPWVNKNATYPVRHPTIHVNPRDQDISHWFGMAQVDILAPEGLFHPVLPVRSGGKLTFPLCSACVKEEQDKPWLDRSHICSHSVEERTLRGTWCTPELVEAVNQGYRILKIHEVWHFSQDNRVTGLFADYVNTWLKIKQEASGWLSDCRTEDQKREYIQQYYEKEGIWLDYEKSAFCTDRSGTLFLSFVRRKFF